MKQFAKFYCKCLCFQKHSFWDNLSADDYIAQKNKLADVLWDQLIKLFPKLSDASILYKDMLTPVTIGRYTGHPNGTLYGGKIKSFDGRTSLNNLHIIGNDQGQIGIMGALTSGVVVSNYNVILPSTQ